MKRPADIYIPSSKPFFGLRELSYPLHDREALVTACGATRLSKHDLDMDTRQQHDFGDGHLPGEFVFVPSEAASREDEGWLIGLVINIADETTDFLILIAQSFEAEPIATVRLPHRTPPGFHGAWFPG